MNAILARPTVTVLDVLADVARRTADRLQDLADRQAVAKYYRITCTATKTPLYLDACEGDELDAVRAARRQNEIVTRLLEQNPRACVTVNLVDLTNAKAEEYRRAGMMEPGR